MDLKRKALILTVTFVALIIFLGLYDYESPSNRNSAAETPSSIAQPKTVSSDEIDSKIKIDQKTNQEASDSKTLEAQTNISSDVLYTKYVAGKEVEVINVERLENGEIAKETYRFPNGKIATIIVTHPEVDEKGYNIRQRQHPYYQYDVDTLEQMSEQNDRYAQFILAYKYLGNDNKKSKTWFLKAAEQGLTAGYFRVAQISEKQKEKIDAYAYYLLADSTGPKTQRSANRSRMDALKLTPEELSAALEKFHNLKIKLKE